MPQPAFYLIDVEGCVEPNLHGPFYDEDARDHAARAVRDAQDYSDALFWLTVDERGVLSIGSYAADFFMEPTGAIMPDGSRVTPWDERLRITGGVPVYD